MEKRNLQSRLRKIFSRNLALKTRTWLFLAYRNKPQQGYQYSPAQRLMSRKLRDVIPAATSQLLPEASLLAGDFPFGNRAPSWIFEARNPGYERARSNIEGEGRGREEKKECRSSH